MRFLRYLLPVLLLSTPPAPAAADSLIPNGTMETADKARADWPAGWSRPEGARWERNGGNAFVRLESPAPGAMVMLYQQYNLPADAKALELSWKQRVTDLKTGEKPWFDARIMLEFRDAAGKTLPDKPSPPYTQKDTQGWEEKRTAMLVPEGAATLVMMPALFQTAAGTFDLDDFTLRPVDPAALLAEKAEQAAREARLHVPDEEPDPKRWPKEARVSGNRLVDADGREILLQGVNAGGLETLPMDRQAVKSAVVAVDDWKANCVRLPIKEDFWYGRSAYQNDGGKAYRALIAKIVTLVANRGSYVVLDLHRFRAPRPEHAEFWKDCAAVYRNHPAVMFDLFNEPHGLSWEVWKNGGFVGDKEKADESAFLSEAERKEHEGFESIGMQALLNAVRSTGARNVVIAGGLAWSNDLTGITEGYALEDPDGNGVMYSWHTYNWHRDWAKNILATAAAHPVFVGEFGADPQKMDFIPADAQEDPATWVPDMLGFIQKHRLNWTAWCFHPAATPRMLLDWDYNPTPFLGIPVKEALAGKDFPMQRMR